MDIDKSSIARELLKKTKKVSKKKSRNMGIGKMGSPETIFLRKFRWTLEGTGLEPHFTKKVKLDFFNKNIHMTAREVTCTKENDINILEWAERVEKYKDCNNDEEIILTTFDGCGVPIYEYKFKGLAIIRRESSYDYSSSETVNQKVMLRYKNYERKYLLSSTKKSEEESYCWSAQLKGENNQTEIVDIEIEDRPKLKIKETQIDFLNAKTWIPGKTKWEKMNLKLGKQGKKLLRELLDGNYDRLVIYCHKGWSSNNDFEPLETWTLLNAKVKKIVDMDEKFCTVKISYNSVAYTQKPLDEKERKSLFATGLGWAPEAL